MSDIKKNYIYNVTYQLLLLMIPLITMPYLSRVLGVKNIGLYSYTQSIAYYFILFSNFGFNLYGQREIAFVQDKKEAYSQTFWEVFFLRLFFVAVNLFVYLIICCRNNPYSRIFIIQAMEIIAVAFDVTWLFQGLEEFKKILFRNSVIKIISTFFIFLLVNGEGDLLKYIFIYSCSVLIANLSLWIYIPGMVYKCKKSNCFIHIIPVIKFFVPQIAISVYTVLDKTMLGGFSEEMIQNGYYEQAQKIVKTVMTLVTSMGTVILPRLALAIARQKTDVVEGYLDKTLRFILFFSIPMMFGIIAISPSFARWYFGEHFAGVSDVMIAFSPIIVWIGLNNTIGMQYLLTVKKNLLFTLIVSSGALSNAILNLKLIPLYGAVGAAMASVSAEMLIALLELYVIKNIISIKKIFSEFIKYSIYGWIMLILLRVLFKTESLKVPQMLLLGVCGAVIYGGIILVTRDEMGMKILFFLKSQINYKKHKEGIG